MSSSGEHSSGPTAGLAALYSFKCKMRNGYGLRASPPLSLPLTRPILVPSFLGVLSFRGVLSFLGVLSFVWRRFMSLRFCATGPSRSRLHLTRAAGHNGSPPVACVAGIVQYFTGYSGRPSWCRGYPRVVDGLCKAGSGERRQPGEPGQDDSALGLVAPFHAGRLVLRAERGT